MRAACLRSSPLSIVAASFALAFAGVLTGCSDTSNGTTTASAGAGASVNTGSAGSGGHSSSNCGLEVPENTEFCASVAASLDCSKASGFADVVCGIPEKVPTTPIVRSTNVMEFGGSGPPDLTCLEAGHYPAPPGTSSKVTVKGNARIFSHGSQSTDLLIEFYTVQRGGANDGMPGSLIGSSFTTASDCTANGIAIVSADGSMTQYECPYEYADVPTETELLVKTSSASSMMWAPLYEYGVYPANSEVKGGIWAHDVRALAADDYNVIPQAATGSPVAPGQGVIAGEVHDCGNVRLTNAVVNINVNYQALVYFAGAETSPSPDAMETATNDLGLYAAFDIVPGPVSAAALGVYNDKATALGFFQGRVFANSVSIVSFRGVQPFQVPK